MNAKKLLLVIALLAVVILFYQLDLHQWLNLDRIQQSQLQINQWVDQHLLTALSGYFVLYIIVTGLSLPGAVPLSLLAGALFGVVYGTVLVSFASTLGATMAFLVARYLFRDQLQQRFHDTLYRINKGLAKDGIHYLLSLRLIPLIPFAAINLAMGLTRMPARTFYWVSQCGMLPATIIFVNAGTQLAAIESSGDILSPTLLASLCALGLLPLISRSLQQSLSHKKRYKNFQRPDRFDRNIIVIGGGAAGLVSALIGSATKAKVTLIEKDKMGGECLNTGCVPSKALLRTARFIADTKRAKAFGVKQTQIEFEFSDIMDRVHEKIARIAPHDSMERFRSLGVECIAGEAKLLSPWEVSVNGQTLTSRHIILATGSRPRIPDISGIDQVPVLTNENIWQLRELPERLLIIGAGAIGCELGQCFARFGSQVTLMQRGTQILSREDPEIADYVANQLKDDGVEICTGHLPIRFETTETGYQLISQHEGVEVCTPFDHVLVASGREPNLKGLGLENLGIDTSADELPVDRYLQTEYPNILACGDLIGPHRFTHAASHQAWYATVNALFGHLKSFAVDYRMIPYTLYCEPEVARIGLNEKEANQQSIPYEVTRYDLSELDRAITDESARGVVKVLTVPGKDKILGVTIVGDLAAEMLAEFALAMKQGLGLNKVLGTVHAYPTYAEGNKFAAGNWRKAHAPQTVLSWMERYHRWRRG